MKDKKVSQSCITLIALIITIIVMLILVVTTVKTVVDTGLFKYAKMAAEGWSTAQENESNIGFSNEDAIKIVIKNHLREEEQNPNLEKILWQSPFQYQLIGSKEQGKIEEKLGRKLEATDYFYEVNQKVLGEIYISETNPLIYNKKEDVLLTVNKTELKRNKSTWWWSMSEDADAYQYFIDENKRIEMLDFLRAEGITELYVSSLESEILENETFVKTFAKQAYERGMVIEYVVGDPGYIKSGTEEIEEQKNKIEMVANYNKNCNYDEKIRGIHYDVEIHTKATIEGIEDWKSSNAEEYKNGLRRVNYIKFVKEVYNASRDKNLLISFDVPPLTYSAALVNYNGVEKSIMEYVTENTDYITCMAYKNDVVDIFRYICLPSNTEYMSDTGRLAYTNSTKTYSDGTLRATDIVNQLALKYKKNIVIGVEIGENNQEDTFYDLGKNQMNNVLNGFEKLISKADEDIVVGERSLKQQANEKCGYTINDFDHYSFAYHHAYEYINMPE